MLKKFLMTATIVATLMPFASYGSSKDDYTCPEQGFGHEPTHPEHVGKGEVIVKSLFNGALGKNEVNGDFTCKFAGGVHKLGKDVCQPGETMDFLGKKCVSKAPNKPDCGDNIDYKDSKNKDKDGHALADTKCYKLHSEITHEKPTVATHDDEVGLKCAAPGKLTAKNGDVWTCEIAGGYYVEDTTRKPNKCDEGFELDVFANNCNKVVKFSSWDEACDKEYPNAHEPKWGLMEGQCISVYKDTYGAPIDRP